MDFLFFGSLILSVLGIAHAGLALLSRAFEPRNKTLLKLMKTESPIITNSTTIWSGSIGFHLSHSLGLFATGFIGAYLGLSDFNIVHESAVLKIFFVSISISYLALSIKYWFILPTIGFMVTTLFYILWSVESFT